MTGIYGIAYALSAAVCLTIAVAAWRRREAPGALGLAFVCAGQAWWSGAYALQSILTDGGPSLFWLLVRFMGLQSVPTAILVLVLQYTGRSRLLSRRMIALLLLQPVSMYILGLTDRWHGLYLGGHEPAFTQALGGPGWWFNVAYSYAIIIVAAILLLARLVRRRAYRVQASVLFVAVMLPVVQFLMQLAGIKLHPELNTVPFTYTLTGVILWFALTRLGLFKVIPVARGQLVEGMPEGIIVLDSGGRIADINPAAMRMTEASRSCVGKTADEAFPHQADAIAALRAGLAADDAKASAISHFGADGVIEATASAVKSREGEGLATLIVLRDITERTRAEAELTKRGEQLAESLERSARVLEAMTDGVLMLDANSVVLQGNPAAAAILRVEAAALDDKPLGEVLPQLAESDIVAHASSTGVSSTTTVTLDDRRSLAVEAIPLQAAPTHGAHTLLVVRDETERLAAERLQRDFIANAAHELQTPLTGLSLLADTIPHALEDDPRRAAGFVQRLVDETQRLVLMTNELLTLSRVDRPAVSEESNTADLSRLVKDEVRRIEPLARSRQQSISVTVPETAVVYGDEIDLAEVAANLLGNAVRYSDPGCDIEVRISLEKDGDDRDWAVLCVTDNGVGIRPEDLERVFERFYRVDKARSRRTGGAGLGLSITRAIVERYGGSVSVESVYGEGSAFSVRLPLAN